MAHPPDFKAVLREYIESLLLAVIVAVILRAFVVAAYKIPTTSMLPGLRVGDFIVVYKLPFGIDVPFSKTKWNTGQKPQRGEILVFRHPQDQSVSVVKRVVGLPGDKVAMTKGALFVNDVAVPSESLIGASLPELQGALVRAEKLADRPFAVVAGTADFAPILVPPNTFFAVGDNRDVSDDSRYFGPVPFDNIEGRVVLIWMSLDWGEKEGGLPSVRWDRLFKRPH